MLMNIPFSSNGSRQDENLSRPLGIPRLPWLGALILAASWTPWFVASIHAQVHQVEQSVDPTRNNADIAALGSGFVVVIGGRIGPENGVFARLLDSSGKPLGDEFRIHEIGTSSDSPEPSVTRLQGGGFAVVWLDNDERNLLGRLFNEAGAPLTQTLNLHQIDGERQLARPQIAPITDGFAVAWGVQDLPGNIDADKGAYLRSFDLLGQPTGNVQELHEDSQNRHFIGDLERLVNGQLAVTWRTTNTSYSEQQLFLHLTDTNGQLVGTQLELSTFGTPNLGNPRIVAEQNRVLFLWRRQISGIRRIIGRFFDVSLGQFVSEPITIDRPGPNLRNEYPDGIATPDGYLIVYLEDQFFYGGLKTTYLDSTGQPVGEEEFLPSSRDPRNPNLSLATGGRPVVQWDDNAGRILSRRIPRFVVAIEEPDVPEACQGESREFNVAVRPHDFPVPMTSDPVALSSDEQDAAFFPPVVDPPGISLFTMEVDFLNFLGFPLAARIVVTGDDGEDEADSYFLELFGYQGPPTKTPPLLEPLNGQYGVDPTPSFAWEDHLESLNIEYVEREVSASAQFEELIEPVDLEPGERYFWRIRGFNYCGAGPYSEMRSFRIRQDPILVYAPGFLGSQRGSELDPEWDIDLISEEGEFVVSSSQTFNREFEPYSVGARGFRVVGRSGIRFGHAGETCSFGFGGHHCGPGAVAADGVSGEFQVVWVENGPGLREVRGSSTGPTSDTAETLVLNAGSSVTQLDMARSPTGEGRFVVSWTQQESGDSDVMALRMASDGSALGSPFEADDESDLETSAASVAFDETTGDFFVAWEAELSNGAQTVRGRRYASDGTPRTGVFELSDHPSIRRDPSVIVGPGNEFLVLWRSSASPGTDSDGWSVQAKRIGTSGPVAPQFQVNSYTMRDQWSPSVDFDPVSGLYLATWRSGGSNGSDQSQWSIQARHLSADGQPVSQDFQVNIDTYGFQYEPKVIASPGTGEFVIAWREPYSLRYRRLPIQALPFFSDGFESGDIMAWQ